MEYTDNSPKEEEKNIVRHHIYNKSVKQIKIIGIIGTLLLSLYIVKIFLTNPDIITCDKTINQCVIEEKPFYASQYTIKEKFNITDIKSIKPYNCLLSKRLYRHTNILFLLSNRSLTAYTCGILYRWYIDDPYSDDQYKDLKNFLESNQQKIILTEPLCKIFHYLFLIWLLCGCLLSIFPIKRKK